MKLTEAERLQVAAAIKHFEALQKRYTKQHNGTACEHVRMALIGLKRMEQEPEVVRCGECISAQTRYGHLECIDGVCYRNTWNDPNFYCGKGRRKGDHYAAD